MVHSFNCVVESFKSLVHWIVMIVFNISLVFAFFAYILMMPIRKGTVCHAKEVFVVVDIFCRGISELSEGYRETGPFWYLDCNLL